MGKEKMVNTITRIIIFIFSIGIVSGNCNNPGNSGSDQATTKSTQTTTKTTQTKTGTKSAQTKKKPSQTATKAKSKTVQKSTKSEPDNKSSKSETDKTFKDIIKIGTQNWALTNLNVSTFRNGDTIPEAKSNSEWVKAGDSGKPVWCYYNNDPRNSLKYGKLYNWYAVNDPRELAPEGWTLSNDEDWTKLTYYLGGEGAAGDKIKSITGWGDGYNGANETGFAAFPGGYREENGKFMNLGSIGIWWSTTENKSLSAVDHYVAQGNGLSRSTSPKQRGESVRCLRK